MRLSATFLIFIVSSFTSFEVDKSAFYKALHLGSEEAIDRELESLTRMKIAPQVSAYQGVLLMKKAGFVKGAKEKLKVFKEGAKKLEDEIDRNPGNVEYRFLRLTIQENAPAILKYNKDLRKDQAAVVAGFEKLDPMVKSVVVDYAEHSKILKEGELKRK